MASLRKKKDISDRGGFSINFNAHYDIIGDRLLEYIQVLQSECIINFGISIITLVVMTTFK
jgi:hypothetical protein